MHAVKTIKIMLVFLKPHREQLFVVQPANPLCHLPSLLMGEQQHENSQQSDLMVPVCLTDYTQFSWMGQMRGDWGQLNIYHFCCRQVILSKDC